MPRDQPLPELRPRAQPMEDDPDKQPRGWSMKAQREMVFEGWSREISRGWFGGMVQGQSRGWSMRDSPEGWPSDAL